MSDAFLTDAESASADFSQTLLPCSSGGEGRGAKAIVHLTTIVRIDETNEYTMTSRCFF